MPRPLPTLPGQHNRLQGRQLVRPAQQTPGPSVGQASTTDSRAVSWSGHTTDSRAVSWSGQHNRLQGRQLVRPHNRLQGRQLVRPHNRLQGRQLVRPAQQTPALIVVKTSTTDLNADHSTTTDCSTDHDRQTPALTTALTGGVPFASVQERRDLGREHHQ